MLNYIASPYSHKEESVREQRFQEVLQFTHWMTLHQHYGIHFSPIVYTHEMVKQFGLPKDHIWWYDFNSHWLMVSSTITVLCIDGWRQSAGVTDEIATAKSMRKPLLYAIPQPNGDYLFEKGT